MRWEDERYVRWYTRNTPEWSVMQWSSRGLFGLIMREVDRAGILELGKLGLKAVAVAVRAPWEEIEGELSELLKDGCVVFREDLRLLVIPNFIDAQEAPASDKARQRSARERARDIARAKSRLVTEASQGVTGPQQPVTKHHADPVNGHSEPSELSLPSPPIRSGPSGRDDSPEAQRSEPDERIWPAGETGYDLALRVWDELWPTKHRRPYLHSTQTGPKSESVALQKLGRLAVDRGAERAEEFVRHWIRAYLKDADAWPSDNNHPIRGLESRINKYGDPKKPKPVAPPKPEPAPEPKRPFVPLQPVSGPAPVRKASTPDELKAKAEADKARLFGNGKV